MTQHIRPVKAKSVVTFPSLRPNHSPRFFRKWVLLIKQGQFRFNSSTQIQFMDQKGLSPTIINFNHSNNTLQEVA